ncbi:MAG TPA: right-handed parallel beta-helix repeat-containing protein, partial [Gemmatimonadales bacterium]
MRRALYFALALAGAGAARAQTVTIRPAGDLSSLVGIPLDVPIVADWTARADKLGSFALTLRWDPAILRYDGGTPGTFGQITSNTDSAPQGVLRLSGANPNGVSGTITLGVGRFTPLDTTGTTLQLQVTELYATAPTFADLIGSAAPQSGLYCAARGLWGDADGDGTVGSRDALLALSNAVGLDVSAFPQIGLADVDTSGVADARDALVILSYAVGMDVSGFRIQRLALGSCGSDVQTNYAIQPGSDTLVQDQDLHLSLVATSTLGAVRTLSDVFWRSSDPTVMGVAQDGRAFATGPGVVTLVGKSGTRDSAVALMRVVARRGHHVVDAAAISAANRIGSQALPFATLDEAARITAEGDTVIVRPGHYADAGNFNTGVVILGQSGGGGVILSTALQPAIQFFNGRRAEVHNVTIDNTYAGIQAFGLDTLVVDSLTYAAAAGTCVAAAVGSSDIRQLVVRRSTLTGDGPGGCTTGIDAFGVVQDLTVDGVEFSDLGNDAISAQTADSVTVRRSNFHDLGAYAIDVDGLGSGAGRLPPPVSLALVVDSSHFARGNNSAVYASAIRSAAITHSAVAGVGSTAVQLYGVGLPGGYARLVGDTLYASGSNDWVGAYDLDSAAVDSVVASGHEGFFSSVTALRTTRSQVLVTNSGTGIYLEPLTLGGTLLADSVTITGEPSCQQCADGIFAEHVPVTVSHFTGSNLSFALQLYDSTVSVTHST